MTKCNLKCLHLFRAKFSYISLCKEFLREINLESSFLRDTAFIFFSVLPFMTSIRRNKIGPQNLQEVLPLVDPGSRALKKRQMVERSSLLSRTTSETVESINTVCFSQDNLSLLPCPLPILLLLPSKQQNFRNFLGEVT